MIKNLFDNIPENLDDEVFESLLETSELKLERIISKAHRTPKGQWYDQQQDEWVILLQGNAGILIEGDRQARNLVPGDYLLLPAHKKHRVEWTADDTETIWLALHFPPRNT